MRVRKWISLLCGLLVFLTGCGGYSDASVEVPGNWASYQVGDLEFRFIAGWKSSSWDSLQTDMDSQVQIVGSSNHLAIFGRLTSPAADKGTVNYIDFGYWDTGRQFENEELEGIMKELDEMVVPIKKLGLSIPGREGAGRLCDAGRAGAAWQPGVSDQLCRFFYGRG